MASINVVLYTSKVLKNGESPIRLRITKDRKSQYVSIGHNATPDQWDAEKQIPKKKHPNSKELTILIGKRVADARTLVLELENSVGDYSLDEFIQRFKRQSKKTTVFTFIDDIVSHLVKEDRIGNSEVYKNLKMVLVRFRKKRDLTFIDVDQTFLKRFEQDLRQRGLKDTSMSVYFRTFRSVFSKAIADGYAKVEKDPFVDFKISKFNIKTPKRAITREELRKIEDLEISDNRMLEIAKDIFIFSFYASGMNMIDMARLEDKNMRGKVMTYIRTKTKQHITLLYIFKNQDRYRHFISTHFTK